MADLRRALPARPRLVVRDGGRLDDDHRRLTARGAYRRPGRRRPDHGPDRGRCRRAAGVVVGGWGYHALAILAMTLAGLVLLAAYVGGRHHPDVAGCHSGAMTDADVADVAVIGGTASTPSSTTRGARRRDAVRRPVGADRGRQGRGPPGGVPAPARGAPRVPAAPDQLPRQPLGAALARRPPGARAVRGRRAAADGRARRPGRPRPARRPHHGPGPDATSRPAPCTCRSPTPTAPRLSARARRRRRRRAARRHDGRHRGAAVLHPRRVAALRRAGLDADQHDRAPRGGAGPRAAACATPRSRWSPTWTPASRPARASARRRCSRCSRQNIERLTGLLADGDRRAARPGRLRLLDLGGRHRPHLRDPVRVLLTGVGRLHRHRDRRGARGRAATRSSGST